MDIYKVVKIIDEYRLVINIGADEGISSKDKFEIFVTGEEVIDPDTKQILGTLDFIKAQIEVETIYPNMSICVNTKKLQGTSLSRLVANAQSAYTNMLSIDEGPEELDVDMSQASGGFNNYDKKIHIGDLVRYSLG